MGSYMSLYYGGVISDVNYDPTPVDNAMYR